MGNIKVDFKNAKSFWKDIIKYAEQVAEIHKNLHEKSNDENEFCGWIDLPTNYDKEEFARIKKQLKNPIRFRCFISYRDWRLIFRS